MNKQNFWKSDCFPGVVVSGVVVLSSNSDIVQSPEREAYDSGVGAAGIRQVAAGIQGRA